MQHERIAVGVAVIVLAMSFGISWSLRPEVRRIKSVPVALHLAKADYRPAALPAAVGHRESWTTPAAQSAGSEWVYEVFTPPVVFYDRQAASFSVTPAGTSRGDSREFALELVAVRRQLFRVQLSGYAGASGSYTAIFTRPGKPGPLLAKENERLKDVGLVVKRFTLEKREIGKTPGDPGFEIVARAELQDERSGAITVLDSESKKYDDTMVATVHLSDLSVATREVREGDLISSGGYAYRISQIECDPAGIIVTREQPGLPPATKLLRPVDSKPSQLVNLPENPAKSLFRPATGIVGNTK